MKVSDFAIKHPAIISILLVVLLLFGVMSAIQLPQDYLADISLPTAMILTTYPGGSPGDIEREITKPLEDELSTISGLDEISSVSLNSLSNIILDFEMGQEVSDRLIDIREKINNVLPDLPEGISGSPSIVEFNSSVKPIFIFTVETAMTNDDLSLFIDDILKPAIARIDGVSEVSINGLRESIVQVELDLDRLEALEIPVLDIYNVLRYSNVAFPGGDVQFQGNRTTIRTEGEYGSLDDLRNVVVSFADEQYIRLSDVASVERVLEKPDLYAVNKGEETITVSIIKKRKADTGKIVASINEVLSEMDDQVDFSVLLDDSRNINLSINSVQRSALLGAFLAILVLLLFLHNGTTTLIVAISIPVSVLMAFIGLKLKGQTINLLTLGGMTVAIGMIVDSSIVVLENIHRHFKAGKSAMEAASIGTSEVGGAIIASTSTSLAAFIPILFLEDFTGIVLKDVALTIIYSLTGAMFVAIIVVPFLSSRILKEQKMKEGGLAQKLSRSIESVIDFMTEQYKRMLHWALESWKFILVVAFLVLGLTFLVFNMLGFQFLEATDMGEIQISIDFPGSYSIEESRDKLLEIEDLIYREVPEATGGLFYAGLNNFFATSPVPDRGFVSLSLSSQGERNRDVFEIIDLLQYEIPRQITDIDVSVVNGGLSSLMAVATGGEGYSLELFGSDMDILIETAETLVRMLEEDPDVDRADMNVSFTSGSLVSRLDLGAMGELGVVPYEAAMTLRAVFHGLDSGVYREGDSDYPIFLTTPYAGGAVGEDAFYRLFADSQTGRKISFATIANLESERSLDTINRKNKVRSVQVTAIPRGSDIRGISTRTAQFIKDRGLPPGVKWQIAGQSAETFNSFKSLLAAMAIAVFLVYVVMVIQFERYTQPLVVMASVPFCIIGVAGGLLIFGSGLSIVAFLGTIALAGIVVNNAIVMIDYINLLRKRDSMELKEAVLYGSSSRLKPILMTTLTTVLGVIPMAVGLGEGSAIYGPLGQTIAGGLITSTFITLFIIPILYFRLEKRKEKK
ncbi:efflux RND transporter permease subunit [Spirochaeta isovalerica]|uniref:HAE1 family hydrophobic/amphiphilic exporter-1 n=1 Tax=Spirochaeta isovalerica TaxID=150 RepID=A0A841R786_9SPIO|nr:efflux RND transporter permease subunit [Spirochaeta isovalerica]MBB6479696.1 HAE1 family hydrophobic/amphiphilic exporter-1 [Spirochaeta isovalerica]